jgi:TolB-like protein
VLFKRLPRWVRWTATVWVAIVVVKGCETPARHDAGKITPAKVEKLNAISQDYQGSVNKNDIAKLGAKIAREFSDDSEDSDEMTDRSPLLAVAFSAPAGDEAAGKLADSAFAMTYGMLAISHHEQVSLSREPLPTRDLGAALERARANHSMYVLYGTVDGSDRAKVLTIKIAKVADGSVVWSKSYPAGGADPAKIAAEVNANLPPLAAS